MTISFTNSMLNALSKAVGFDVKSYPTYEGDLHIYGANDEYAEASLYIDFIAHHVYVTIYLVEGRDLDKEIKVRLDF